MPPRFREHTGARQNARHSTERWVYSIQTGTRQNPGLRVIFIAPTKLRRFLPFSMPPRGLLQKLFLQQPYFYALQVVLGYADIVLPQFKRPLQLDGAFHSQGDFSFVCNISKEFFLFPGMSSNKSPLGPHFAAGHFSLRPPVRSWL